MSNSLSAKILRKKVDDAGFGPNKVKRYSFLVAYQGNETWISAFADERRMPPEVIETLKALGEGDRAEFSLEENVGKKDGKTYLNIVGVTRETDVHDDVASSPPAVQPSGQPEPPRVKPSDAPDSMILSYAKDGAIRLSQDGDKPEEFVRKVFIIYGGLKAILAGAYQPESDDVPF